MPRYSRPLAGLFLLSPLVAHGQESCTRLEGGAGGIPAPEVLTERLFRQAGVSFYGVADTSGYRLTIENATEKGAQISFSLRSRLETEGGGSREVGAGTYCLDLEARTFSTPVTLSPPSALRDAFVTGVRITDLGISGREASLDPEQPHDTAAPAEPPGNSPFTGLGGGEIWRNRCAAAGLERRRLTACISYYEAAAARAAAELGAFTGTRASCLEEYAAVRESLATRLGRTAFSDTVEAYAAPACLDPEIAAWDRTGFDRLCAGEAPQRLGVETFGCGLLSPAASAGPPPSDAASPAGGA